MILVLVKRQFELKFPGEDLSISHPVFFSEAWYWRNSAVSTTSLIISTDDLS
jgi:hypothetical protein